VKTDKIKLFLNKNLPKPVWTAGAKIYKRYLKFIYLHGKRPVLTGETFKAKNRRLREGFFDKYCIGQGLDIGFGGDLILPNVQGWDFEHGDAQYLNGIPDNKYDYVYSSHTLEHVEDAAEMIKNCFRVLKPGGHLILYIPHRDLYEKKKNLPSRFNENHKRFFLVDRDEYPDTIGIVPLIERSLKDFNIIYAKECSEGHTILDPEIHSDGEYSIEVVIKKV